MAQLVCSWLDELGLEHYSEEELLRQLVVRSIHPSEPFHTIHH